MAGADTVRQNPYRPILSMVGCVAVAAVPPTVFAASSLRREPEQHPLSPNRPSPASGPIGLRARVGLRLKRPHADAGMRIEPPPSVPWAIGSMPEATAAAAPPLEPPAVCVSFHGLRVGPKSRGSVDGARPISGVLDLPVMTRPARRRRAVISLSWLAT